MNNNEIRNEQKLEAIERMKILNLHENTISDFKEEVINLSEEHGALYWLDEKQIQLVKNFEEKHNSVVYHAILTHTTIGSMLSLLYVSRYLNEWEMDRNDLKEGYPLSYVINLEDDMCSEFGTIGIKVQYGGLIRTS